MPSILTSPRHDTGRPRRSLRWIAILLASILLHVIVFNWANGRIALPSLGEDATVVVTTELVAVPPKAEAPPPPVASAPKRKVRPRRPAPPPVAPAPVQEETPALAAAPESPAEPAAETPATEPPAAEAQPVEPPADTTAESKAESKAASYKIDPPPPAELSYDVEAKRDGSQWYGSGMFQWSTSGNGYLITGEASVTILFKITVLNFRSEGLVNETGIAPVLYSEKPWRKAATNTHFQHDRQTISFSASESTFPYQGGEQDRASIMWQLAGIGRGDAGQFTPGATLDIVVAGARKAETWHIQVIGQEDISTPFGNMQAWHVVRAPIPGSYDQKIDIWLAPQHEWYPVKLRYTYANGDHLDMSLSDLKQTTIE